MKGFISFSQKFQKEFPNLKASIEKTIKRYAFQEAYIASPGKDSKKKLSESEIVIIEDTFNSTDTGFDLATAAYLKKPILVLRMKDKTEGERNYSSKSKRLRELEIVEYTEKTLDNEIKTFINKAKKLIDTKFILIISPEIDKYLQWVSENRRMHKAQIVRKAVESLMENDPEYKTEYKAE
ncbi:hypothetical protein JW796_01495 [Candidatus Dojkabacteria bacterium]|nr:hypothetical protein [Candidatus Dojkabacteria bacterium]